MTHKASSWLGTFKNTFTIGRTQVTFIQTVFQSFCKQKKRKKIYLFQYKVLIILIVIWSKAQSQAKINHSTVAASAALVWQDLASALSIGLTLMVLLEYYKQILSNSKINHVVKGKSYGNKVKEEGSVILKAFLIFVSIFL